MATTTYYATTADQQLAEAQRMLDTHITSSAADGLDLAFLSGINQHADLPDMAVILTADPDTIAGRVAARGAHNRYQGGTAPAAAEIAYYSQAVAHIQHAGSTVLCIDTTNTTPDLVAVRIAAEIATIRRTPPQHPAEQPDDRQTAAPHTPAR